MPKHNSDKARNDRALRFYRDVLGLERLHYGLWNDGDELSFDALKNAQQRYEDLLVANVPRGSERVLDVGCGTGEMCLTLKRMGFAVEGLSPDRNQRKAFAEKVRAPFHFTTFEGFDTEPSCYDCIIMSESAQYIPLDRLFENASKVLKPGGRLIVCDYFVTDHDAGPLSRSGHCYQTFLSRAQASAFEIVSQRDITAEAARTLDMGKLLADRILVGFEILTERVRHRHPLSAKLVAWLFRKKIAKMQEQLELLDTKRFCETKRYELFVFKSLKAASSKEENASALGAA